MNIDSRLYVEIVPLEGVHAPHPHPVNEGGFDLARVYKVLGMYNASESSECFLILANPARQIWFIPQRHLRAFALMDGDAFSLSKDEANRRLHTRPILTDSPPPGERTRQTEPPTQDAECVPHKHGEGRRDFQPPDEPDRRTRPHPSHHSPLAEPWTDSGEGQVE